MAAAVTPQGELSASEIRAGLALVEAILPGSARVPAADERTFQRASSLVAHFHPTALHGWRYGVRALDAAAFAYTGRPFHALDAARQEELLRRWQRDPVLKAPLNAFALICKLAHFDRDEVYSTLGGKLNVVTNLEQPRWLSQVHRADDWNEGDLECDVVVIGTGAGGGVVGKELADRGLAVVYVEEGEHYRRDAFDGRSVSAHERFYRGAISAGNAPMPIFMGRLVGGSTAINGGTCFRTPSWVHDRWCEELGSDALSSRALDPYYRRVEEFLEVGPSPRNVIGPIGDFFARGCDTLGWSHFPVQRNALGCDGKGFCDFGCRTDARRGTNLSYVPAALGKGALLLTAARAERVRFDGAGRASGIDVVTPRGKRLRVNSRAVVLAGGAVPTSLFLLQQGLANSSGQVGRNLSLHPSTGFAAMASEPINPAGHAPQGYGCDEFLREGILTLAAQADYNFCSVMFSIVGQRLMEALDQFEHVAGFALLVSDHAASGRVWRDVGGLPAITYNLAPQDVRRLHDAMIYTGEMSLAAGARRLYPLVSGVDPIDDRKGLEAFRRMKLGPTDFALTSYHPLGTCRMGRDPKTSVLDLDHQTHDHPGLFVVDGSAVRGPIGVNPQLTIMAMATRAAEGIAARL